MNTRLLRNGLVWLVVIGAVIAIAYFIFGGGEDVETIAFGEVVEEIKKGEVESLTVNGKDLEVLYFSTDPEVENIKKTEISESTDIVTYLTDEGIAITTFRYSPLFTTANDCVVCTHEWWGEGD